MDVEVQCAAIRAESCSIFVNYFFSSLQSIRRTQHICLAKMDRRIHFTKFWRGRGNPCVFLLLQRNKSIVMQCDHIHEDTMCPLQRARLAARHSRAQGVSTSSE